MTAAKRIAVVATNQDGPWGGSEELWARMAEEGRKQGHEVLLSVYDWPIAHHRVSELHRLGVRVLKRPLPSQRRNIPARAVAKLRRSLPLIPQARSPFEPIFSEKPDVICVTQGGAYDTVDHPGLLDMLFESSIPYVVICQFNDDAHVLPEYAREAGMNLFARAGCVVFVSQDNVRVAERQLATPLSNAIVLRNPVNLTDLSIVPWPSATTANLATVARLAARFKGQDVLFESLSARAWRSRDWRLRLYGEGRDETYLKALAHHYGIADRTDFMGQVRNVRAIWAENHLLVLPSRAEGTPLAMVEAMICGRPAVVTDVGGNVEWVDEPRTGFIAEAATARSFGAALERAWRARPEWEDIGTRARAQALVKFDPSPGRTLLGVLLDTARKGWGG